MDDLFSLKNPFASFGEAEETVTKTETEEETLETAEMPSGLYDVRFGGSWNRFPFVVKAVVLKTVGDTLFFESSKKSFRFERKEVNEKKLLTFIPPTSIRIKTSAIFPIDINVTWETGLTLSFAKLAAWSQTLSDDEMEPVVRQEITRFCWFYTLYYAWIPAFIAFSWTLSVWVTRGWVVAIGPAHGLILVCIGWAIAVLWRNKRGAVALPTGCFTCALDYMVNSFFVQNPEERTAYWFFAFLMCIFGGLCCLPFYGNAKIQRQFTEELNNAAVADENDDYVPHD